VVDLGEADLGTLMVESFFGDLVAEDFEATFVEHRVLIMVMIGLRKDLV